jgi:hypothetical protein
MCYYNTILEKVQDQKKNEKKKCLDYISYSKTPLHNDYKILICTPSNSAIDLIANRLINEGLFSIHG